MIPTTRGDFLGGEGDQMSSTLGFFPSFIAKTSHPGSVTDEDGLLVTRCQSGDIDAFELLVERHEQRVRSIVSRILVPSTDCRTLLMTADIDDLSQDIFVQAWRALPSFRGDAKFSTWLYRVAVNRALKEYNHRRRGSGRLHGVPVSDDLLRHLAATHPDPDAPELDPEGLLQQRARDSALRIAIDELPEKQRLVVLLHYFEDCSCEEISTIACCSVGTVWSRLHYACRRLQERLSWMDPRLGR
jgi:RNA polymerase sigma-70 factor (ECF subfamily)